MSAQTLPVYFPQFVTSVRKLSEVLAQDQTHDLHVRFKAHPLQVLMEFDAPINQLHKGIRAELESRLRQVDMLEASSCLGCKIGLEVALAVVGGVAACAIAILLAPEVLVASPFIIAVATFFSIEAATVATIFLGVIATFGTVAAIVFTEFVETMCEKMGAC